MQRSGSNRARRVGSSAIVTVGIVALSAGLLARAGRVPPAAAPAGAPQAPATVSPPLTPAEAQKTFRLAPGYRLELVASEPLVADPVWMDMDPDGRLWVVEMRGFMPTFEGTGEDAPVGQVVVLEDTDDDGRADKRTVFLDGLVQPRTVKVLDRGVLVIAPPQLILARDTDGDLKADAREVLRTRRRRQGRQPGAQPQQPAVGARQLALHVRIRHRFPLDPHRTREREDALARPVGHLDGRQRADLSQLQRRSAARRLPARSTAGAQPVRGADARCLRAGHGRSRGVGGAADAGRQPRLSRRRAAAGRIARHVPGGRDADRVPRRSAARRRPRQRVRHRAGRQPGAALRREGGRRRPHHRDQRASARASSSRRPTSGSVRSTCSRRPTARSTSPTCIAA